MRTINKGNSVFTNVALTEDGDIWWEGLENPPAKATSWKGEAWTPESDFLSSHPNSRYCTPIKQCDILAPEYDDPRGVPIDAILFGGRRKTTVPLVFEARDWTHGTFLGATLSSETTAAAVGAVGVVRRDPMAMLPFIGYNAGDYFNHWITVGKDNDAAKLPKIFYVNWFRRDDEGDFLWPGFGENSRVLKWVVERIDGQAAAVETPIGHVPTPESLDTDGPRHDRRGARGGAARSTSRSGRPRSRRSRSGSRSSARTCRRCSGPSWTGCAPAWAPDRRRRSRRGPARPGGASSVVQLWNHQPDRFGGTGGRAEGERSVEAYGPEDRALFEADGTDALRGDGRRQGGICHRGPAGSCRGRRPLNEALRAAAPRSAWLSMTADGAPGRRRTPPTVQSRVVSPLGPGGRAAADRVLAVGARPSATLDPRLAARAARVGRRTRSPTCTRTAIDPFIAGLVADCEEEMLTAQPQAIREHRRTCRIARAARHRTCSSAAPRSARSTSTAPAATPSPASTSPRSPSAAARCAPSTSSSTG